ncbi:MAG: amidohydrolase family protein [Planctomycetia bacterium]|nr:amidohydrolase family protein [Planctomycetia bacterium]
MRATGCLCLAWSLVLSANTLLSQERPQAFVGARIIRIEADEIDSGVLVIEKGKIVAVGAAGEVQIPDGANKVDVAGRVIMPGLVDTHSHIGGSGGLGGADGSGPIQPGVRIYDSINVHDSGFKRAVAGGLTTLNIMPGSGHLISGQTLYAKLRLANPKPKKIDQFFIVDSDGAPMGGLKMANGTNSQHEPPFPGTRGKSAFLVREQYIKAREYQDKIVRAAGDPAKLPPRDLNLEALVEAMRGKRIVHHHTHRHDDIMTVLRLAQEFNLHVVLHHVSDGWKVADEIAAAHVPCSVIVIDSPGGKLEARYARFETGGILEKAGVLTAFHTDDWITDARVFRRSAALAVRAGMSRAGALKALTLAGAEMLGLDKRIGSLAPGKDADFAILENDPLSVYCKTLETWVEGVKVFDRGDPTDYLYAVGGYGAGHDQSPYLCCFDDADTGGAR